MKRNLLTDIELRAHWSRTRAATYYVEENTLLTPAARDFVREHNIQLCPLPAPGAQAESAMTTTPIPTQGGRARYQDAVSGGALDRKPEEMTHLRGNLLVPKTHPRIAFRGKLDSLMAQILELEVAAEEAGEGKLLEDLEELLAFTRQILAAEVKDEPLPPIQLLGLDNEAIREHSHHVKRYFGMNHPIPSRQMGRLPLALNRLRTQVREVELAACQAFSQEGVFTRTDLIEGLNRMSSCVYIIFCRKLSGDYEKGDRP